MLPLLSAAAILALASTSPCKAPQPHAGAVLEGVVLHVIDGRRLCIATGPTPDAWTEIELKAETPWPTVSSGTEISKAALMSVAFARRAVCTVTASDGGPAKAQCRIDGAPIETLLARPGTLEAAAAWLPRPKGSMLAER